MCLCSDVLNIDDLPRPPSHLYAQDVRCMQQCRSHLKSSITQGGGHKSVADSLNLCCLCPREACEFKRSDFGSGCHEGAVISLRGHSPCSTTITTWVENTLAAWDKLIVPWKSSATLARVRLGKCRAGVGVSLPTACPAGCGGGTPTATCRGCHTTMLEENSHRTANV